MIQDLIYEGVFGEQRDAPVAAYLSLGLRLCLIRCGLILRDDAFWGNILQPTLVPLGDSGVTMGQ